MDYKVFDVGFPLITQQQEENEVEEIDMELKVMVDVTSGRVEDPVRYL